MASGTACQEGVGSVHRWPPVTCKQVGYDARNNRLVGQCFAGDDDLQAMMVSAGWAWSFGQYSNRYAPEEREAVTAKLGVHGHKCLPPWEWRAQHWKAHTCTPWRSTIGLIYCTAPSATRC